MPSPMAKSNLRRIGTVIGTAFTLFTTNWNPVVSALLALGAAGWAYATQWGYLAVVAIAFAIFTTFVWLINGIIWFNRRNEVQTVRPEADISYALAYVGSNLGFNDTNPDATVQIGIN